VSRDLSVSDGVDPAVQGMEAPGSNPAIDRFFTEAGGKKLLSPDDPLLTPRQLGQRPIVAASPPEPVFRKGWRGLGGEHGPLRAAGGK
jgi:hypothetical protein